MPERQEPGNVSDTYEGLDIGDLVRCINPNGKLNGSDTYYIEDVYDLPSGRGRIWFVDVANLDRNESNVMGAFAERFRRVEDDDA